MESLVPEGDTIYRTAVILRKALLGQRVTRFETTVPQVAAAVARSPIEGRETLAIEARGKHLLIAFGARLPPNSNSSSNSILPKLPSSRTSSSSVGDALLLHTHMRMTGSWHI